MIGFDVTRRLNNPRFRSWSMPGQMHFDPSALTRDIVKDNKRQQILFRPRLHSLRRVPAFTIQTEQVNTKPYTPALGLSKQRQMYLFARPAPPPPDENLKKFLCLYEDRQFPIRITSGGSLKSNSNQYNRSIEWQVDPNQLKAYDRRELLKRFAVGLPVEKEPYCLIAVQGFKDLLSTEHGAQMLADSLTEVIPSVRKGLNSPRLWKKLEMLDLLRQMAQMPGIGQLLVPFYRMILPPLRIGKATRISTDISTSDRDRLHNSIDKTLMVLEQTGGQNAYINIKYLIPEHQSFYQ